MKTPSISTIATILVLGVQVQAKGGGGSGHGGGTPGGHINDQPPPYEKIHGGATLPNVPPPPYEKIPGGGAVGGDHKIQSGIIGGGTGAMGGVGAVGGGSKPHSGIPKTALLGGTAVGGTGLIGAGEALDGLDVLHGLHHAGQMINGGHNVGGGGTASGAGTVSAPPTVPPPPTVGGGGTVGGQGVRAGVVAGGVAATALGAALLALMPPGFDPRILEDVLLPDHTAELGMCKITMKTFKGGNCEAMVECPDGSSQLYGGPNGEPYDHCHRDEPQTIYHPRTGNMTLTFKEKDGSGQGQGLTTPELQLPALGYSLKINVDTISRESSKHRDCKHGKDCGEGPFMCMRGDVKKAFAKSQRKVWYCAIPQISTQVW